MLLRRHLLRLATAIAELRNNGRWLPWRISLAMTLNAQLLEPLSVAAHVAMRGAWDATIDDFQAARQALIDQGGGEEKQEALRAEWDTRLAAAHAAQQERWREIADQPASPTEYGQLRRVPVVLWEEIPGEVSIDMAEALLPMILLDEEQPRIDQPPAAPPEAAIDDSMPPGTHETAPTRH